jgi:phytoene dehydrogenase-like protein
LLVDGDASHRMPATLSTILTTSAIGLRAKLRLLRLFAGLRRPTDPALANLSVEQWLDRELDDPELRRVLIALIGIGTYCRRPDRLSADAAREQLRVAVHGVLYLDGGWGQLATALEDLARREKVELALGAGVDAIERRGDRWHVQSAAGEHQAAQLLLALPPAPAGKLMREAGIEPSWAEPEPLHAACLDIGLLGPWTEPDVVLDLGKPIYMSVQSNYGDRAPSGCSLVSTLWYRRPEDDALSTDQIRAELEAMVDRWIPDRVARTLEHQYLPNMMVIGDLPRPEHGGLAGRTSIEPEPARAPGLWLAGDWVGDRGLLGDAALASASAVARSILGRRREPIRRSA